MMLSKTRSRSRHPKPDAQKEFKAHTDFVKSQPCICAATHWFECKGDVVAAHYRTAANSGTGTKPHDAYTLPLCDHHHRGVQHQKGQRAFEERYGVSMLAAAKHYAAQSPVPDVRAVAAGM